jgi:transposase
VTSADERIARLEAQVEALLATVAAQAARIAALEAENAELRRRLGENSSNSNKPPSTDAPADRQARRKDEPSGKRRGGQPGHKGHKRTFLPAAQVRSSTHCFPDECRRCGHGLPKRRDPHPIHHQVADVPEVEPFGDDYWQHRVACDRCGEITCGTLPDGVPHGMLGPRVLALIAVLVADGHMSRRKVQALLRDAFGLDVSLGALSESEQIVSDAVAPAVEEARLHALAEQVKHIDATTWYQAGAYRSLWTLATAAVTVFTIAADASRATLRTWLDQVKGVLVSDRGTQFDFWVITRRQICWAHLIRKFASFGELRGRPGEIGRELLLWSRVLLHAWHRVRDGTGSRAELRRVATNLRALIERLLDEGARAPGKGFPGACAHILAHREAMWRFVDDPAVEPTNNHAERELRGLVCWRRSSGGSRSERGNQFAANLKSVLHTCRKQRRHVLTYLNSAIHAALRNRKTPSLLAAA